MREPKKVFRIIKVNSKCGVMFWNITKPIDNYIVDFFCAKAYLAIELDGSGHYGLEEAKADKLRTEKLNKLGVDVIRFCNLDVDKNFIGVCEMIDREIRKRYVF